MTDTQRLVERIDAQMSMYECDLRTALIAVLRDLDGGYSIVASDGDVLIGVRDPWGLRPLSYGSDGERHYFSSEDSALNDDCTSTSVEPGDMVVITKNGVEYDRIYDVSETTFCSMEESYFARPDTTFEGRNVQSTRYEKGRLMASQEHESFTADIVVGVPESGLDDALGYADALGIPFQRAITKNQYIGRTFIQANQTLRTAAARQKFRVNRWLVEGRRIVLVDDSLVRGTNSRVLVDMLRKSGAAEVHLRIMFPEHRFPCHYGIDTGDPTQLLANRMDREEMVKSLDADSLQFITPDNLRAAINPVVGGVCMACVTGEYPTNNQSLVDLDLVMLNQK